MNGDFYFKETSRKFRPTVREVEESWIKVKESGLNVGVYLESRSLQDYITSKTPATLSSRHTPDHNHKWVERRKRARAAWNTTVCQRSKNISRLNQRGSSSTSTFMMWPSSWRRWGRHWNIHVFIRGHKLWHFDLFGEEKADNRLISSCVLSDAFVLRGIFVEK